MNKLYSIFLRYILLILIAISNLWLFYFILTPLTIYPVFFLLNIFFNVSVSGITLSMQGFQIELARACIAGSAYYLLLILNLTTPMPLKKRINSIVFSLFFFLLFNILRIFFFSILFINSFAFFNLFHLIFWYFISSFLVFIIWVAEIKIFKIKQIPVYSDIWYLYQKIKTT
ncbi:MAG: pacearchaeosortase [Nanoarchaeota archaeon]|nr:pacearchaeosortase [Nanoarchaeota archaeon]